MRTTQAHRYARWSAIVAAVLAVVVLAIYFRRSWQANQAEKNAPPPVPSSIQKSSQGFSWTWGNQDHTLLVLHASNATEFKKGNLSVLNDVSVTIYGAKGDRADEYAHAIVRLPCSSKPHGLCGGCKDGSAKRRRSAPLGRRACG